MSEADLGVLKVQKELFKSSRKEAPFYILGIGAMFAGTQLSLLTSIIFGRFVDEVIVPKDASRFWLYPILFLLATLLLSFMNYCNRYFNDKGGYRTIYRLRDQMFKKIQSQSLNYLSTETPGQVLAKTTSDLDVIRSYLSRNFRVGLNALYYYISIGLTIYFIEKQFLLVYFTLLPILFIISAYYGRTVRPIIKLRREEFGKMSSDIQEKVEGIEVIKAFGAEDIETETFRQKAQNYLDLYLKTVIIRNLSIPLAVFIVSAASVLVVIQGGILIINGTVAGLTVGELILLNLFMLQLRTPTRLFGNFIVGINSVTISGRRVFSLLHSEEDIKDEPDAKPLIIQEGTITFDDVSFSFDGRSKVLDNLNFTIEGGKTVAILGSSGSGKSTLIQLIPRFYDPTEGRILIDGQDIKQVTVDTLRKSIGIVTQETFLFSRSVRDNIAFGKPDATDEEIKEAARLARADEFIERLPQGYDTIIGERGITLSGGQQQRLAIARCLLVRPKILIFDDSTSSIDAKTEYELHKEISGLLEGRTILIVTQKLSSVRFAEKIIVLDEGEIIEEGTHEQLMENRGIYKEIVQTQTTFQLEKEAIAKE